MVCQLWADEEAEHSGRRRMRALGLARPGETLSVLCLGAHSDDIEIGCGGTLLNWIDRGVALGGLLGRLRAPWARVPTRRPNQPRHSCKGWRRRRSCCASFATAIFPIRASSSRTGSNL